MRLHRRRQRGAAAIEFALLFLLFFVLFYALVSYAAVMLLVTAFEHAAEEGARSAISVDPLAFGSSGAYQTAVETQVRTTVNASLRWLPAKAKAQVLSGNGVSIEPIVGGVLIVHVKYVGYATNPLMPILTLPIVGAVPNVPADLEGVARLQL